MTNLEKLAVLTADETRRILVALGWTWEPDDEEGVPSPEDAFAEAGAVVEDIIAERLRVSEGGGRPEWVKSEVEKAQRPKVGSCGHGPANPSNCKICGRDNRNGTHDALESVGHLRHHWQPPRTAPLQDAEEVGE